MDLTENLNESWTYMTKLMEDIGNLIILFILNVIPIVNFTVWGYGAKITREGEKLDKPPKMDNYVEAFIDGLKIIVVAILYLIIPTIILFGSIALTAGGIRTLFSPTFLISILLSGIGVAGIIFSLIIGFLFLIVGAMGIIYMIKTEEFGKAFSINEILRLIGEVGWGRYIGWLVVIFVLAVIVTAIGNLTPVRGINWIISNLIGVFFTVLVARSAHHIYPEKTE